MTEGDIEGYPLNYGTFLSADTFVTPVTVLVCRRSSEATSLFRDVVIKCLRSESN